MELLFVYGLFRDSARNLLGKKEYLGKDYVKGNIYYVNEFYPGFVEGKGKVLGDVYVIDEKVLPELDEFEGYEYERVRIKTLNNLECWIYKYKFAVTDFKKIEAGDWMLR